MYELKENPKLANSNIIDCIPQTGECPLNCAECYYNGGRFYRSLNDPEIPTLEASIEKIVRVNSGHDSNLEFDNVMKVTEKYEDKFYNTSLPMLRFNNPVVLTINSRDDDYTFYHRGDIEGNLDELMFVRFRVNTWNIPLCIEAIEEWNPVPLVLTDMRYYNRDLVKEPQYYNFRKHILNAYWRLNEKGTSKIFELLKLPNVFWCGNPFSLSTMCEECRVCELFYIATKVRLKSLGLS